MSNLQERPIRFNLLNKDELIYEITIRDGVPATTVDKLRIQIRELNTQIPTDEVATFTGDVGSELGIVQHKLTELQELCGQQPLLLKRLNRIQALGNHLFHRLSRIEPTDDEDCQLKSDLDKILLDITKRLDRMVHNFSSSFEFPPPEGDEVTETGANTAVSVNPGLSCDRASQVHTLNHKFNGKGSVHAFLERLDELCISRNISTIKLFNSASELFSEEALFWYRSIKGDVRDWSQLRGLLLEEYLPYDFEYRLLEEIRSRTQGPDESIVSYLSVMHSFFSRLKRALSEEEKLEIIKYNIRPFYTTQLALVECSSLQELKTRCRQLEAAQQRSVSFREPPRNPTNVLATDLIYKGKQSKPCAKVEKFCVRCRIVGHSLNECKAPHVLVCFKCGEKGVTSRTCSKCSNTKN